jgi:hypothetical protein
MRLILIIQTIIIAAGAYYIYTLRQQDDMVTESTAETVPVPPPVPVRTEPAPVAATSTTEVQTGISGPNDAGMEWPTLEEEPQSR